MPSYINIYRTMVSLNPLLKNSRNETESNILTVKEQKHEEYNDQFFDRKVENITEGLKPDCYRQFYKIPYNNAITVVTIFYHEV